jgi:hypothetical protein
VTRLVVVVLPCAPAMAMPRFEAHQLGQHQRARHHRDFFLARGQHLGVVGLHGGRGDHRIGTRNVRGA